MSEIKYYIDSVKENLDFVSVNSIPRFGSVNLFDTSVLLRNMSPENSRILVSPFSYITQNVYGELESFVKASRSIGRIQPREIKRRLYSFCEENIIEVDSIIGSNLFLGIEDDILKSLEDYTTKGMIRLEYKKRQHELVKIISKVYNSEKNHPLTGKNLNETLTSLLVKKETGKISKELERRNLVGYRRNLDEIKRNCVDVVKNKNLSRLETPHGYLEKFSFSPSNVAHYANLFLGDLIKTKVIRRNVGANFKNPKVTDRGLVLTSYMILPSFEEDSNDFVIVSNDRDINDLLELRKKIEINPESIERYF